MRTADPFEVFIAVGKAGGCDSAQLEGISRLTTLALRAGIDPKQVVEHLQGITCCPAWEGGTLVRSAPDALALVLKRNLKLDDDVPPAEEEARSTQPGLFLADVDKPTNGHVSTERQQVPGVLSRHPRVPGGLQALPRVRVQQVRVVPSADRRGCGGLSGRR